jgi:hypothetical protein
MDAQLDRELAEVLATLGVQERRNVLEYARSLQAVDETPTPSLMDLVGSISKEDLQLMREAIEDEFERVHAPA